MQFFALLFGSLLASHPIEAGKKSVHELHTETGKSIVFEHKGNCNWGEKNWGNYATEDDRNWQAVLRRDEMRGEVDHLRRLSALSLISNAQQTITLTYIQIAEKIQGGKANKYLKIRIHKNLFKILLRHTKSILLTNP